MCRALHLLLVPLSPLHPFPEMPAPGTGVTLLLSVVSPSPHLSPSQAGFLAVCYSPDCSSPPTNGAKGELITCSPKTHPNPSTTSAATCQVTMSPLSRSPSCLHTCHPYPPPPPQPSSPTVLKLQPLKLFQVHLSPPLLSDCLSVTAAVASASPLAPSHSCLYS